MANGIYTVGGAVQADQGIYITRRADQELFNLCRNGTFAYVLTARQMGKSAWWSALPSAWVKRAFAR